MFNSLFYRQQQTLKRQILTVLMYFLTQFFGVMAIAYIMVTLFHISSDVIQLYASQILFWLSLGSFVMAIALNYQYLKQHLSSISISRTVRYAMLFTFIGVLLSVLVAAIFVSDVTSSNQQIIQQLVGQSPIYLFITVVLLAPVTEEITFRLALQGMISRKSRILGAVVSFILFIMLHLSTELINGTLTLEGFAAYLAMPLVLTYIYYRTNNLILVIFIHILNNLLSFLIMLSLL